MTDDKTTNEPIPNKTKRPTQKKTMGPALSGGSREARRTAAVVLEVLAGGRTPSDAAAALGASLPKYYALEGRALAGLLAACEPKPRGKQRSVETELAVTQKELERAHRESARYQALVRASQRTVGVAPPAVKPPAKGKRRKRPMVRALKVAQSLQSDPTTIPPTAEPSN